MGFILAVAKIISGNTAISMEALLDSLPKVRL